MTEQEHRGEQSLLLYLETRAVDHAGRVDQRHMSRRDFVVAELWHAKGYVSFGRIQARDAHLEHGAHWCHLSAEAHADAARLRAEKASRTWAARRYVTTEEKRSGRLSDD